jgi:hypothetical protein
MDERRHADPWATPEPGFEKYQGPKTEDGFQPMDSQAFDLGTFLRSEEARAFIGQPTRKSEPTGAVTLPDGTPAQLTQKQDGTWELMTHVRRDIYRIFTARSRDEVLRLAIGGGSAE